MLHQGPAQYEVVVVEQPLAVGAERCGETLGLIGKKDPIGIKNPPCSEKVALAPAEFFL